MNTDSSWPKPAGQPSTPSLENAVAGQTRPPPAATPPLAQGDDRVNAGDVAGVAVLTAAAVGKSFLDYVLGWLVFIGVIAVGVTLSMVVAAVAAPIWGVCFFFFYFGCYLCRPLVRLIMSSRAQRAAGPPPPGSRKKDNTMQSLYAVSSAGIGIVCFGILGMILLVEAGVQ